MSVVPEQCSNNAPNVLQLAAAARAAYNNPLSGSSLGSSAYHVIAAVQNADGFAAVAYQWDGQVIISFRGTEPSTFSNILADGSFLTGAANGMMALYVADAVAFLSSVMESVNASTGSYSITLTGHSLGGAVAELVGSDTGFRTVTFNAPGNQNFLTDTDIQDSLSQVGPSQGSGLTPADPITSYRLPNDLASVIGDHPAGAQIENIADTSLSDTGAISEHLIDNVISALLTLRPNLPDDLPCPAPCFRQGTLIRTTRGEVPVEALAVGDRVITKSGAARPVHWIGHRHLDLTRHPAPERAKPVRILAGAFADGAPRRDLFLSPDHAVLRGGLLIPAKLLVNGASIQRDIACRAVTYYHVELETHDILIAENLAVESYLDTGNRGCFENSDTPLELHPDFASDQARREAKSRATFASGATTVEPIWRELAARATRRGLPLPARPETTNDPALYVVVDGRRLAPVSTARGRHVFPLPRCAGLVRLVSRSAIPNEMKPWLDDPRRLGVLLRGITSPRATAIPVRRR